MESDQAYFARRAAEEWFAVSAANCDQARIAHFELAKRYVELADKSNNVIRLVRVDSPPPACGCQPAPATCEEAEAQVGA